MDPSIKFIIAGDFEQLLPVKDRLGDRSFKGSCALHELCDGQKLHLTKCRRANKELFDLVKPDNIRNVSKTDFGSKFTDRRCTVTNKRRI